MSHGFKNRARLSAIGSRLSAGHSSITRIVFMSDFPTESQPERRNWVWLGFQAVMRLVFALWVRFRARGHDRITHRGGMLLIINHQSFLDPLLVGVPLRRPVSFVARENLFRVPFIGWVLRNTYVLPINRESAGTAVLREMIARLKAGFWVGIFPEGHVVRRHGAPHRHHQPGADMSLCTFCHRIPVSEFPRRRGKPRKDARVQPDRDENDHPGDDLGEKGRDMRQDQPVADHRDGQRAKHGAHNGPLTSHQ